MAYLSGPPGRMSYVFCMCVCRLCLALNWVPRIGLEWSGCCSLAFIDMAADNLLFISILAAWAWSWLLSARFLGPHIVLVEFHCCRSCYLCYFHIIFISYCCYLCVGGGIVIIVALTVNIDVVVAVVFYITRPPLSALKHAPFEFALKAIPGISGIHNMYSLYRWHV